MRWQRKIWNSLSFIIWNLCEQYGHCKENRKPTDKLSFLTANILTHKTLKNRFIYYIFESFTILSLPSFLFKKNAQPKVSEKNMRCKTKLLRFIKTYKTCPFPAKMVSLDWNSCFLHETNWPPVKAPRCMLVRPVI